jgi:tRNA1Val (adenine37-N6)-methyltransferase
MKFRRPFRFKQFEVAQEGGCMPVTTDACIFGALAGIGNAKNVLDIGTGTGLLSLMLAQRFPEAHFTAVDIDEASVNQAHLNFENSPWKDRLNAVKADIREWEPGTQFDAIVCNPPFFENQLPSESEDKRRARHTLTLDFKTLLDTINLLVKDDGMCWLLLPCLHLNQIAIAAHKNALYFHHSINIRSFDDSEPHVAAICLSKINKGKCDSYLTLYNKPGIYSEETQALMKDFYLLLN